MSILSPKMFLLLTSKGTKSCIMIIFAKHWIVIYITSLSDIFGSSYRPHSSCKFRVVDIIFWFGCVNCVVAWSFIVFWIFFISLFLWSLHLSNFHCPSIVIGIRIDQVFGKSISIIFCKLRMFGWLLVNQFFIFCVIN